MNIQIKVLLVDDTELSQAMLEMALAEVNGICLRAANGFEALRLLKEHADIDVIVLDLMMPEMDGFQLLEELKHDVRCAGIPVIVVSADSQSVLRVLEAGVQDFIAKPFNLTEVALRIRNLARTRREHELSNLSKGDFYTAVSHELRTPLNGIYGLTDILQEKVGPGEVCEHLGELKDAIGGMTGIINNLIDYCVIDAVGMQSDLTGFSLLDVVEQAVGSLSERAEAKSVQIRIETLPDTPMGLLGYPDRLRKIFYNLLDISLKLAPAAGKVQVRIGVTARNADQLSYYCTVQDNGIGIDAAELGALFLPITQEVGGGSSSVCKRFGGAGIGLVVALKLARSIGGNIETRTDFGYGNTFCLTFTALHDLSNTFCRTAQSHDAQTSDVPPLQILLAEDNPVNQRVAVWQLEKMGHSVDIAMNGMDAVERWKRGSYDLIFMDLHMPEMDGFEATRLIREAEEITGKHIPIVALTAYSGEASEASCRSAGMDSFVAKPVRPAELVCVIRQVVCI